MRPVRTPSTNRTYVLAGGTEANDLPAEVAHDADHDPCIRTTWELTPDERRVLLEGGRIELVVWGEGHPPVYLKVEYPHHCGTEPMVPEGNGQARKLRCPACGATRTA